MSRMIRFPELGDLIIDTGLSENRIHKITGVSRNTLAAMRNNRDVSANSVIKLLNGLQDNDAADVREYRAVLQRRMSTRRERKVAANGGPTLAVDNSDPEAPGRRTSRFIAADLCARMKVCAELASELADAMIDGDSDVTEDDPRHIKRFHNKLNEDLEEVYRQLLKVVPDEGAEDR